MGDGGESERTAAGGEREDAQQSNSGHPGLDLCSGVYLGDRKGASGQQRLWDSESELAWRQGGVMSVGCGLRGVQSWRASDKRSGGCLATLAVGSGSCRAEHE